MRLAKIFHRFLIMLHLSLTVTFHTQAVNQDAVFLNGFTDVPLLEGFSPDPQRSIIYDTASGTIAETVLVADSTLYLQKKALYDIYDQSLKALGWSCRLSAFLQCQKSSIVIQISATEADKKVTEVSVKSFPEHE